jgi:hypothetical protein
LPANGLRCSHCGVATVEALSCGRDRVRWPVPLADLTIPRPAVEPAALCDRPDAAGSLVLRRVDCGGHKSGLVRAKKYGTKSGSGAPGGGFVSCLAAPQYTPGGKTNEAT